MLTIADPLIIRAGLYQLLALGYGYPSPSQRAQVAGLAAELAALVDGGAGPGGDRPVGLGAALAEVADTWAEVTVTELEGDFNVLFSGNLACPPHETAYEPDVFRRQRALADIAGFHHAFGFDVGEATRWQSDHIGVETEFCSIVLQRQAGAVEQGWDEAADVCADALASFLTDHLGRWHRSLASLLVDTAVTAAYRALALLTRAVVDTEVEGLGLRPEPLAARPRGFADDDEVPNCGGCAP